MATPSSRPKSAAWAGPRASVDVEGEVARIVTAPDRQLAQRVRPLRTNDAPDAGGRLLDAEPEGTSDLLFDGRGGGAPVERHAATEERDCADDAQHQIGVSDGHPFPPRAGNRRVRGWHPRWRGRPPTVRCARLAIETPPAPMTRI